MYVIGDVHNKIGAYLDALQYSVNIFWNESIQVGDMGLEYGALPEMENHRFIMGNHDNYDTPHPNALEDYGMYGNVFYVRGAESIDKAHRVEGVNWWREEELGYGKMMEALEAYASIKPDFVVTHDCPHSIYKHVTHVDNDRPRSRTSAMLDEMYEIHQPERWIFGHHHYSNTIYYEKTAFTCLDELEIFNLETGNSFRISYSNTSYGI